MPTQIQRDLSAWSETEPETDEEGGIPIRQNQLVHPFISCLHQCHYLQSKGVLGGAR